MDIIKKCLYYLSVAWYKVICVIAYPSPHTRVSFCKCGKRSCKCYKHRKNKVDRPVFLEDESVGKKEAKPNKGKQNSRKKNYKKKPSSGKPKKQSTAPSN